MTRKAIEGDLAGAKVNAGFRSLLNSESSAGK
jgi:hypothetical protein